MSLSIGGGLHNLGNTCFFNAAMQCVLHSPPLALLLQARTHSQACPLSARQQWCAFCEMENVYGRTRDVRSYAPSGMVNHLRLIFKKFRLGRQEDSHQFLRYLIEGMQESETGKAGKDKEAHEALIKSSRIFGVFGAMMKTCVECLGCGYKSITKQRYYDLNIQCQRSNTLPEGLNSFFSVDKLEGANKYHCEKCKNRCNGRKRFLLDTTPQVATFQFKRFTNMARKIGKYVQYPLTLDMGRHLEHPRRVVYKLFGVVVHAGSASWSGHYYAFVRSRDSWFKMDDSYVSKCSPESALGQNAYLLFYEKVHEEPAPVATDNQTTQEASVTTTTSETLMHESEVKKVIKDKTQEPPKKKVETKPIISKPQPKPQQKPQQKEAIVAQQEEEDLQPPSQLRKTKSKEQCEHEVPYQQLLLHTIGRMIELNSKLRGSRPRNNTNRRVYDLRRYERSMQKRRKLG